MMTPSSRVPRGRRRPCTGSERQARRVTMAMPVLLLGLMVAASGEAAETSLRLDAIPWGPHVLPAVLTAEDSMSRRSLVPDTLSEAKRPRLAASFRAFTPKVDGDLADWTLVRWNDLAGAASLVRGTWSGPADFALRFAVSWNDSGISFAARLLDDRMTGGIPPLRTLESLTLAVASEAPFVEYSWLGGARRFRVRADGNVDAWTDVRNRRTEPFDAAALGVQGAAHRDPTAGRLEVELFVPWTALYPALPHPAAGLLANVILDDVDDNVEKRAVWTVRQTAKGAIPAWARLDLEGGPRDGWFVTSGTRHPETVAEWVVLSRADHPAASVEVRTRDAARANAAGARATLGGRGPFVLRLQGVPSGGRSPWPEQRAYGIELRLPGAALRRFDGTLPVEAAVLDSLLATLRADTLGSRRSAFPNGADAEVRVSAALRAVANLGNWQEHRLHPTGILAFRAASFEAADRALAEAALLRAALQAGSEAARARLRTRWPALGSTGVPVGVPLLRGYRSEIDGSAQPYVLYMPTRAVAPAPLLVVLHDLGEDAWAPTTGTAVVAQCAERGWALVCPTGRGDVGYQGAGERDVVDVLDAVRKALPVDGTRLYVTGSSMGGTGSWLLALRHPRLFAAASIVSGYGDLDQSEIFTELHYQPAERDWFEAHNPHRLVGPKMITAFRVAQAEADPVVSPMHARIMRERFLELHVPLEFRLAPGADHGPRFFDDDLASGLEFLARAHLPEDGHADMQRFAGSGPPVADVWGRGPFAIVWGTRGSAPPPRQVEKEVVKPHPQDDRAAAQEVAAVYWARYGAEPRLLPDSLVTPEMAAQMNLILVGDPTSNRLLARWADRLPVRYEPGLFTVEGKTYPVPKYGILFAAANPEFPARTLVVCTALAARLQSFPRPPLDLGAAYAIVGEAREMFQVGNFGTAP